MMRLLKLLTAIFITLSLMSGTVYAKKDKSDSGYKAKSEKSHKQKYRDEEESKGKQ